MILSDKNEKIADEVIDTPNFRIFFRKGKSNFLWVTFAYWQHSTDQYWGRAFAEEMDYSVLGFVDKRNAWFSGFDEVLSIAKDFIASYDMKIGTGVSMGGYAAIKNSSSLSLDRVLAIAPQFSIDPNTIYDFRYYSSFIPSLHKEMDIKKGDVGGSIYTLMDPFYAPDMAQQKLINNAINPHEIFSYFMGHYAISTIKGYEQMNASLEALIDDDKDGLKTIVAKGKRAAIERPIGLFCASWEKHPEMSRAILERYAVNIPLKLLRESVIELARELTFKDKRNTAIEIMEQTLTVFPDCRDIQFECSQHLHPVDLEKSINYARQAAIDGNPQYINWVRDIFVSP